MSRQKKSTAPATVNWLDPKTINALRDNANLTIHKTIERMLITETPPEMTPDQGHQLKIFQVFETVCEDPEIAALIAQLQHAMTEGPPHEAAVLGVEYGFIHGLTMGSAAEADMATFERDKYFRSISENAAAAGKNSGLIKAEQWTKKVRPEIEKKLAQGFNVSQAVRQVTAMVRTGQLPATLN